MGAAMRHIPLIISWFVLLVVSLLSLGLGVYIDFFSDKPQSPGMNTVPFYLSGLVIGLIAILIAGGFSSDPDDEKVDDKKVAENKAP